MIIKSADSLLGVINDILDFSKIEAGRLNLEAIPFNLRDILGDTLQALGLRADEKGLELNYHIPPEVPDRLVGDPLRLRQILVNLVGNSIHRKRRGRRRSAAGIGHREGGASGIRGSRHRGRYQ